MRNEHDLTINLLGGFRILVGGRPVPDHAWRLRKAQVLVQMLALAPQHALHREQIMTLLWPDLDPIAAARNLHQVLHFARRALAGSALRHPSGSGPPPLVVRRQVVRLQPGASMWVDVKAFESASAQARRLRSAPAYARALSLYEGDLLPESPYDDVFSGRRQRLRDLRRELLLEKGALEEAGQDWREALETYRLLLLDDPTVEPAVAGLLRACATLGARDEATRHFQAYTQQIRDELGLKPNPELIRLYGTVRQGPGRPAKITPLGDTPGHKERAPDTSLAGASGTLPLVGRDRELQSILQGINSSDGGAIFLVTGEPGIGKSRLAWEVSRRLATAGMAAVFGFGTADGPPLWPWHQVLQAYERSAGLRPAAVAPTVDDPAATASMADLALKVSEFLNAGPPALIVLEDLHEFDPESLRLLVEGLPWLLRSRTCFLITCRTPFHPSGALADAMRRLRRIATERIELPPLDLRATHDLARAAERPDRAGWVHSRSAGNPFFATQLLSSQGQELPWPVRESIADRLRGLDPAHRHLLHLAAVMGDSFTLDALYSMAGMPPAEIQDALNEAQVAGLLRPVQDGYEFTAVILREALLEEINPADREALQRQAAGAVVPCMLAAGREALKQGAKTRASRLLERALELSPGDAPGRAEILLLLAICTEPHQILRQQALLERAVVEASRSGDSLIKALAHKMLAEVLLSQNDEHGLELLEPAKKDLARLRSDPRAAELEALLDQRTPLYPGLLPLTGATGQQAPAIYVPATQIPDDHWAAALVHLIEGDVHKGAKHMTAAGEQLMAARNFTSATLTFSSALNLRLIHLGTNRTGILATVDRMQEAAGLARENHDSDPFPGDHFMLPYWYWYGQWDKVRLVYEDFAQKGGTIADHFPGFTHIYGAEVLREQGDPSRSLVQYAALLPSIGPDNPPASTHYMPQMLYTVLAVRTMIAAGEYEMARIWLKTLHAWHRGPRPNLISHIWSLIEWAEWHRAQGNREAMRRLAMHALQLTRQIPATSVEFNAWRLAGAAGGPDADYCLTRALDLAQRCGYPFDVARALFERGLVKDRPADLQAARRIFRQLNAGPYLRRIDAALGQSPGDAGQVP